MLNRMRRFLACSKGALAVNFSLMMVPTVGLMGMAVDYGSASRLRSELQGALDAAALVAISNPSAANLSTSITTYLVEKGLADASVTSAAITTANGKKTLSVRAQTSISTMVMGLISGSGGVLTIEASSDVEGTLKPASYTFTPLAQKGWYAKDLYLWTKDSSGAIVSMTKVISYDYDFGTMVGTSVPPLNVDSVSYALPANYTTGLMMRIYPTGEACGQTRAQCASLAKDYYTDAPNASTYITRSAPSCADVGGQTNGWEDGGDTDFLDFVYTLRCTLSTTAVVNPHIVR